MATKLARMNAYIDAEHDPRDAAHGKTLLDFIEGRLQGLQASYPADPALAAEDVLETLRHIQPQLYQLHQWAEDVAHQSFAPAPETGGTV